MKFKFIYTTLIAGAALLFATACYDYRNENMEEYQTMVYFRNGGEQSLALYSTGEDGYYAIPICKGGRNLEGTISVQVLAFDDTRVALYNAANYTNYSAIPSELFSFLKEDGQTPINENPDTVEFGPDDASKVIYVRMNTVAVGQLMAANPDKKYILGFQLFSNDKVSDGVNYLLLTPEIEVPYLSLSTTGVESYSYDASNTPAGIDYSNRVKLKIDSNRWPFTCYLEVKDEAWLEQYNAEHETNYDLLPAEFYEMPTELEFPVRTTEVEFNITVKPEGMPKLRELVIPVAIKGCSKEEFVPYTSDEADDYVFMLQVLMNSDTPINLYASQITPFYEGTTGHKYDSLVDGDEKTYWASPGSAKYGGFPGDSEWGFYFDIELENPLSVFVLNYCASATAVRCPSRIKLGVKTNADDDFTLMKDVAYENMRNLTGWYALPLVKRSTPFKYIRVGLIETYINNGVQSLVIDAVDMTCEVAELKLYGSEN